MMTAVQKQVALTLVACILGGIAAYLQYSLPNSDPKAVIDTEWKLPDLPDASATLNAYNALSQYYRKTTIATQGAGPSGQQQVQAWTLQGMVQQDSQHYALIKIGTKITRYRVGEQLPDMSTLTAINNNGITTELAGKTIAITLHGGQRK